MSKTSRITIRATQELFDELQKIADVERRKLSNVCHNILEREVVKIQMRAARKKLKGA